MNSLAQMMKSLGTHSPEKEKPKEEEKEKAEPPKP
jgi:hypothetical protein